jgi:hypothetical protein
MGETFLIALGLAMLALVLIDILWTTLWIDGAAGPLTRLVTILSWWPLRNTMGRISNRLLSISGAWILSWIFLAWVTILFLGWYLIFSANIASVIDSKTEQVSNWVDKIYFVGYSLTTLGNGDFKPAKGTYQLLTPIITVTGFVTLSLSLTYSISVISAAVNKMNVASKITSLGETAEDFVIRLWQGNNFNSTDMVLNTISSELNMLNEQHKAYPVLHYFHTSEHKKSLAYALTILDDALNIYEFAMEKMERPSHFIIFNCRQIIADYLKTISSTEFYEKGLIPPAISIHKLKEAGIKTLEENKISRDMHQQRDRRKLLYQMVKNDGWDWYTLLKSKAEK